MRARLGARVLLQRELLLPGCPLRVGRTPYPFMRCYCSICRKTQGGGRCTINIMGDAAA